jgi:phosphoribosylaminoimidazole carboxylase
MDKTVGVLGGGQLGRMLAEAANRLNIKLISLDKPDSPTKQITAHGDHVSGSFKDAHAIRVLAEKCDVLTYEIEHVDTQVLQAIAKEPKKTTGKAVSIEPSWETINLIQDKLVQKRHLRDAGIPVADFAQLTKNTEDELKRVAKLCNFPFMLKSRRDAYDGRGNYVVYSEADFGSALAALGTSPLYAERWAPFTMELAVMVVKTSTKALAFPTVETIHENSICKLVFAPPRGVLEDTLLKARELATKTIATLSGKGVFAVEMFLLPNDELLVNEVCISSGHA